MFRGLEYIRDSDEAAETQFPSNISQLASNDFQSLGSEKDMKPGHYLILQSVDPIYVWVYYKYSTCEPL